MGGGDGTGQPRIKVTTEIEEQIELSLPRGSGQRNAMVFQLIRRLQCLEQITPETPPMTLIDVLKTWWERALRKARQLGFTIDGSFSETLGDFLYGWDKVKVPYGQSFAAAIEKVRIGLVGDPPDAVREAASLLLAEEKDLLALILLCYHLHELWEGQGFFLSCRSAAKVLSDLNIVPERNFGWTAYHLKLLVNAGILRYVIQVKPGLTRKHASSYAWNLASSQPETHG